MESGRPGLVQGHRLSQKITCLPALESAFKNSTSQRPLNMI